MAASTTTMTIRIPVETKEKLDRLAEATQRSRSFLAADALSSYANDELEIVEGILRGLEDVEAGRVVRHEEAMAELRERVTKAGAKVKRRTA